MNAGYGVAYTDEAVDDLRGSCMGSVISKSSSDNRKSARSGLAPGDYVYHGAPLYGGVFLFRFFAEGLHFIDGDIHYRIMELRAAFVLGGDALLQRGALPKETTVRAV